MMGPRNSGVLRTSTPFRIPSKNYATFILTLLGLTVWLGSLRAADRDPPPDAIAALRQLRTFATTGRVLHVGAHPDDENTQLIAFLSLGRGYDTAYLSITRGDGGQNILGPDFDEKLGVARTQELLAARRIDGGQQFFTRAVDFGFSKNPEETLAIWNRTEVLGDVVRVIRRFRPDVIVTRFPVPPGSGGHGHHTASAMLALEAFKLAGDPKAYPEQLRDGLEPWQPKRIVWNMGFSRPGGLDKNATVTMDIGGSDPTTGEPFGSIAARSRSMHRTQGFGDFANRSSSGPRVENFAHFAGDVAPSDLMDGIDTSWARIPGADEIGTMAAAAIAAFQINDPSASVPALLAIRNRLGGLPASAIVVEKRAQLDRALQLCIGLVAESITESPTVVPGETIPVSVGLRVNATVPVTWVAINAPGARISVNEGLKTAVGVTRALSYAVPKNIRISQPYWLHSRATLGLYGVDDAKLIGNPESPSELPLTFVIRIGDQELNVVRELHFREVSQASSDARVAVVPPVRLHFGAGVQLFHPGVPGSVTLEVVANRGELSGVAELGAPAGWQVSAAQPFSCARAGDIVRLDFVVTPPVGTQSGSITAQARISNATWTTDAVAVAYPHIPRQLLQPAARKKVTSVDVEIRGHSIGYVPGAGDDIPDALTQLGYKVTTLQSADLTAENLKTYDAVVIGVRAFNTRDDSSAVVAALSAYAEAGGTVIGQYNWARNLKAPQPAPYPLKLSELRVTNEDAPVTILAPENPVLNTPNKILASDFAGWVQERGVYFPSEWDPHFVPILAMSDLGEPALSGALLVARHGRGYYIYTGLAFFRQLPAGVPGAYRLFANLVSLGK